MGLSQSDPLKIRVIINSKFQLWLCVIGLGVTPSEHVQLKGPCGVSIVIERFSETRIPTQGIQYAETFPSFFPTTKCAAHAGFLEKCRLLKVESRLQSLHNPVLPLPTQIFTTLAKQYSITITHVRQGNRETFRGRTA